MAKTFRLEIVTPEKLFFEGEAESLVVETPAGQIGILAGHSPLVIGLRPGIMRFKTADGEKEAVNTDGFAEVRKDKTVVLCQTMEWPEEIEINRVKHRIAEEERKLREARSIVEYKMGKACLARAFARLRGAKR